jgi:hypothetical protein
MSMNRLSGIRHSGIKIRKYGFPGSAASTANMSEFVF